MIAEQVKANRQAVAKLTLCKMEWEAFSEHSLAPSVIFYEEPPFQNIFASDTKDKLGTSKQPKA